MTYYTIKSSHTSLEEFYKLLHMIEHYETCEKAKEVLLKADPDIIPKDSIIYRIEENATDFNWPTATVSIKLTPA